MKPLLSLTMALAIGIQSPYSQSSTPQHCPLGSGASASPQRLCLGDNPAQASPSPWTFSSTVENPWGLKAHWNGVVQVSWPGSSWRGESYFAWSQIDTLFQALSLGNELSITLAKNSHWGMGLEVRTQRYSAAPSAIEVDWRGGGLIQIHKSVWMGQFTYIELATLLHPFTCWIVQNGLHWRSIPAGGSTDLELILRARRTPSLLMGQSLPLSSGFGLQLAMGAPPLRYAVLLRWGSPRGGIAAGGTRVAQLPETPGLHAFFQPEERP